MVKVKCGSKLVVNQFTSKFEANDNRMRRYKDAILRDLGTFIQYELQ